MTRELYGPVPPPTGKRGRPRKKGERIGTCKDAAEAAAERYSWRWAIEPSNATGRQLTGAGDPAAGIARCRSRCPWYTAKATPSAADMHTALGDELPTTRISGIIPGQDSPQKNIPELVTSNATAV